MKNLIPSQTAIETVTDTKPIKVKEVIDRAGFKLECSPERPKVLAGGLMFAYTIAVLRVAGMLTNGRKQAPQGALSCAYKTSTAITWHLGEGNIERVKDQAGFRVTKKGLPFILNRKHDSTYADQLEQALLGNTTDIPKEYTDKGIRLVPQNYPAYK